MDAKWWACINISAGALRQSIKVALLASGIDPTDEAVGYIARRMCEADGRSLLDEVTASMQRELDALRETNERLTDEIERLRLELAVRRGEGATTMAALCAGGQSTERSRDE